MVFQHFALFPHRNVIDNVGYGLKVQRVGRDERNQASLQALSLVGLAPFAEHRPAQLSGGMQQRVGLARALASDPDILLMDEAFSALDPLIRRQMQDELMEIQSRVHKTILFITHDLNEALRIGDRVCIMKDGAVVQIGTPEEILTEPATGYVAEFVQDVDQGRVIKVHEVMVDPTPLSEDQTLSDAITQVGDAMGRFCCDANGRPTALLTISDGLRVQSMGSDELKAALRADFDKCSPDSTLNDLYAAAGRGLPVAVVDDDGKLIGNLDPRMIMEEMGRVEQLIEGFERESVHVSGSTAIGAGVLAQADPDEYQGHFIDRFIDTVTSPEAGDVIVDWIQLGIEWLVVIALFAIPALMVFGGIRARRYGIGAGGLIGLLAIGWYRSRPKEIVASGETTFTGEDGETFECLNAIVDEEGELLECSSGLVSQVRQNSVLDQWRVPVGDWVEQTVFWVDNNLKSTLEVIEWPFAVLINLIVDEWLVGMSWVTVSLVFFALGWAMRGFQVGRALVRRAAHLRTAGQGLLAGDGPHHRIHRRGRSPVRDRRHPDRGAVRAG